jgi:hypothetical protein
MSFSIGWAVLTVLSLVVLTSWVVLASKFAKEDATPKVKVLTKPALPSDAELKKMTKAKIEEVGREFGIDLDKRKTKANMIADLFAANI